MAFDNNVDLTGNLGADPEYKVFDSGARKLSFSIGIYAGKDRDSDWVDIVCWNDLADNVADRIHKGDRVTVRGSLKHEKWESKEGQKRSKHVVFADDVALSLRFRKPSGSVQQQTQQSVQQEPDLVPAATPEIPF